MEDNKEVQKTGDSKAIKDIDKKGLNGRTSCLRRNKEEAIGRIHLTVPTESRGSSMHFRNKIT